MCTAGRPCDIKDIHMRVHTLKFILIGKKTFGTMTIKKIARKYINLRHHYNNNSYLLIVCLFFCSGWM